ncbi:MAG: 1-deoxy-D-xylulose-5-phosphate synthase [Holophagaceae bacterium]
MKHYPLLDSLSHPEAIQTLQPKELEQLAQEVRQFLIDSISVTGGHFASNLGTVELTVALFNQFDLRSDRVLWDVGHQAYPHKILTGRKSQFKTLRQHGGLSGFLRRSESPMYDHFGAGHASTSISAGVGMAKARDLAGEDHAVVAVIGDGSMTAGMAFEGLNQAGYLELKNFLVILNDNDMSINPNVGSLQGYLNQLMSGQYYVRWRDRIESIIKSIPVDTLSKSVAKLAKWSEETLKRIFIPGLLFEDLGFNYLGPVNGNDVLATQKLLLQAKERMKHGPVLLHVQTKKGFGYAPAQQDPLKWHGVTSFDPVAGEINKSPSVAHPSYTKVFAEALSHLAEKDHKIVGVTAAMLDGTGLNLFQKRFPDRTFDVGIAEQHAVTFAAGMATKGYKPVCAIYSTFLQRGYDQVVHDVCLQNLPVVFAMDRAGLVGADGPTHHGLYDIPYLRCLPNMVSMAPKDENELRHMLCTAIELGQPASLRYPRGNGYGVHLDPVLKAIPLGKGELLRSGGDLCLIPLGTLVTPALEAAEILSTKGIECSVINPRFIKPLDTSLMAQAINQAQAVITMEDGVLEGGFGSAILELMSLKGIQKPSLRLGVPDRVIEHGDPKRLAEEVGLTSDLIATQILKFKTQLFG